MFSKEFHKEENSIFWIGDSTVQDNDFTTYPQTGIGQGLRLFMRDKSKLKNYAKNGRSTKSFIDLGELACVYDKLRSGDLLLIQFGHNDSKVEDPTRFARPEEYKENLKVMINMVRNRQAQPVLITPLSRCWFKDDVHLEDNIHGEYPKSMKEVAKEMDIPLIDLFTKSKNILESLGKVESLKLFMTLKPNTYTNYSKGLKDETHLRFDGAMVFANIIVEELMKLDLGCEQWFNGYLSDSYKIVMTEKNKEI